MSGGGDRAHLTVPLAHQHGAVHAHGSASSVVVTAVAHESASAGVSRAPHESAASLPSALSVQSVGESTAVSSVSSTLPPPLRFTRVCVFCGSASGTLPAFTEQAKALGCSLAARGYGLVYGGGSVGLMGDMARAVIAGGQRVVGVIPEALMPRELSGEMLGELHVTKTMHERKSLMADMSDAFIAMPGGFGTMEELMEMLTWAQLGVHNKPIGLLNVEGFFEPLVAMWERACAVGLLRPVFRQLFVMASTADELLDKLESHRQPKGIAQWMTTTHT